VTATHLSGSAPKRSRVRGDFESQTTYPDFRHILLLYALKNLFSVNGDIFRRANPQPQPVTRSHTSNPEPVPIKWHASSFVVFTFASQHLLEVVLPAVTTRPSRAVDRTSRQSQAIRSKETGPLKIVFFLLFFLLPGLPGIRFLSGRRPPCSPAGAPLPGSRNTLIVRGGFPTLLIAAGREITKGLALILQRSANAANDYGALHGSIDELGFYW
jgi:hypothetical protein